MGEKTTTVLSEELLKQINGGEGVDVAAYSEEELAQIFELYFQMYGEFNALPYLASFGVTTGDYYLMDRDRYWQETPYAGAPRVWKLAHLVYQRNH